MNVFVAGASSAVGKRLVPQLVAAGYHIVGMSRSAEGADSVRAMGAVPVAVDAFDRDAVVRAVTDAAPDVLVHQLTGLTGVSDFKNFDQGFALTNRLRTDATDHLLEGPAARVMGYLPETPLVARGAGSGGNEGVTIRRRAALSRRPPRLSLSHRLGFIRH